MSDSGPTNNLPHSSRSGTGSASLGGDMGVLSLMLTVLAFSAPMAVVAGYLAFVVLFGGPGATVAFVIASVLLLLFAVGYVTMTNRIPRPGSFYAFISAGLGKTTGLGSAFLAVASYLLLLCGVYPFLGLTATEFVSAIGGSETPWWLWSILAWVAVSVLCYFNIAISARVLSVVLGLEVVVILLFDAAVVFDGGGPEGFSFTPLSPTEFFSQGSVAVAMLFAIMVFVGFEATAIFRDETRTPEKTIPRATYGAVLFVGVLYTVSCYLLMTAYGSSAVDAATENSKTMFSLAIGDFVAGPFTELTLLMIVTSEFAAGIAIHNVAARYIFNLGRDKALPSYLGKAHPRHRSPARASVVVTVLAALIVVPLGLETPKGVGLDAQLFGLGTVGILILMTAVSISVIAWFARSGMGDGENWFKCFAAPATATLALGFIVVYAVSNFTLVVGGEPGQNLLLLIVLAVAAIIGIWRALHLRSANPQIFAELGGAEGKEGG